MHRRIAPVKNAPPAPSVADQLQTKSTITLAFSPMTIAAMTPASAVSQTGATSAPILGLTR